MVRTKKGEKEKKRLSIKKHSVPHLGLGGLSHKKRREEPLKGRIMSGNIARQNIWKRYVYLFEPIPEKFGYSLGGYSHRERCRAPDRKKSTKERTEVEVDDKEPVDGQSGLGAISCISLAMNFGYIVDKMNIN
jgi:hypothetical protein